MGTDKNRIWDDCAECAYKHLTAAYAALTAEPFAAKGPVSVDLSSVQLARAAIAYRETKAGYIGNRHLAYGCMAFSEQICRPELVLALRDFRVAHKGPPELPAPVCQAAWTAANILEAFRELPELADRLHPDTDDWKIDASGFHAENPEALCTKLNDAIVWLYNTFELGGHTNE